MAASQNMMYSHYLLRLHPDQLLYTNMDSVILFVDKRNEHHMKLPTSDMLGDLKDEYTELTAENPHWYMQEFMAFGPKMYQLVLRDSHSSKVVHWDKMMKGISLKGNHDLFSVKSLHKYRDPVINYCTILQHGDPECYKTYKN